MVASQDANKENVDVTRNVPCVKKSENVLKNALEVPLKTRGNDAMLLFSIGKSRKRELTTMSKQISSAHL